MSAPYKNIIILGAGGNVGQIILRGLLKAPQLTITAIKRPASASVLPSAPNFRVVESDYNLDSLASTFHGQDAVISVVGATGIGEQKLYVDAAVKAGVKRFFPSEFGINGQSKAVQALTPFFAVKQDLLDYLVEKEKTGLTWTGLIVGPIFDWCIATGFIGYDISAKKATIWDDGNTQFSGTNEDDLGRAVVGCLEHPSETTNKFVYVSSLTTTQNKTLAALEKVMSTKWTVEKVQTEGKLAEAREELGNGNFNGALTMVKATVLGNLPGLEQNYEESAKDLLANELLGIPRASVEETVKQLLARGV